MDKTTLVTVVEAVLIPISELAMVYLFAANGAEIDEQRRQGKNQSNQKGSEKKTDKK